MNRRMRRSGAANYLVLFLIGSLVVLAVLVLFLVRGERRGPAASADKSVGDSSGTSAEGLFVFCAAGLRTPVERIASEYEREYGASVQLQYGGSATLLGQLELSEAGDLYLAGDETYVRQAREKGLVREEIPVARMRPVVAVNKNNPKNIRGLDDLLRQDVRVAIGNPDQSAIGKLTRQLLTDAGKWEALENRVQAGGVFKPTVPEVANDVKLGSVDAGIVWDSTVAEYPELQAIRSPELDRGTAHITIGAASKAKDPTAALRFARYLAARDRGLKQFAASGFEPVDGDVWEETPNLTFFVGSVNRRALEPVIKRFEQREGVVLNTVYNGCGILTAQMRTMEQNQDKGFPDVYMACDVYYLNTVRDLFQEAADISNTDIVIVVQKGNPKGVKTLKDLLKPGVRVAIGQPDQCTIGALTRRLLQNEGIYDELLAHNVVTQTATSALLVPNVTTKSADAVLAYITDTRAEADKLEVIPIKSPLALAIQPFSIAESSKFKYLGRRLFDAIAASRESFESAGFRWDLSPAGLGPVGDAIPPEPKGASLAASPKTDSSEHQGSAPKAEKPDQTPAAPKAK